METAERERRLHLPGNGLRLAASAWGSPADPLVVLLHGGGQTRHAWGGAGASLAAAGFHAVALDMRGHGESDWAPDGDYSREQVVADLAAVVDELGTVPALVGASAGGITALLAAGEKRVDAWAVVLVDIVPRVEPAGARRIVDFMTSRPDGFGSLDEAADAVAGYLPERPRPVDPEGLRKNLRLGPDGRWRWHWDPLFLNRDRLRHDSYARFVAAARSLRPPTLLVRGMLSDIVSPEGVAEFLELAPHAEFIDVAGAGHMVAGDRNDPFATAVLDFLVGVRPVT